MYKTDGYNIMIPRGDSALIPFTFMYDYEEPEPFIFEPGQYMILSVFMDKNKEPYIQKRANAEDQDPKTGEIIISFTPEDTDITRYRYNYTIRLYNADKTEVDTWHGFPKPAFFDVT